MKWFTNFSLRNKIGTMLGFISLILLIIVVYSYENLNEIRKNQESVSSRYIEIRTEAVKIREEIFNFRIGLLESLISENAKGIAILESDFSTDSLMYAASLQNLRGLVKNDVVYEYTIQGLSTAVTEYTKQTQRHLKALKERRSTALIDSIFINQSELYTSVVSNSADIVEMSKKDIAKIFHDTDSRLFKTIIFFLSAAIFFFIATGYILVQSTKTVADPLNNLADASENIAKGDISISIPNLNRKDEVGKLNNAFQIMVASLNELSSLIEQIAAGDLTVEIIPKSEKDKTVISLHAMVNNFRKILSETKESINILSTSTSKIFAGTTQLSTSSNQTAAAIGETTVTIEEVKKTSEVLSNKAREISILAQKASEYSDSGIHATDDTIQGIRNIGSQMAIIGESIGKLSEQSRAIADIISTVNDLAEQSNLLAVNAAIEAARAGEHGKSFVIVAQEIKDLARQSKLATSQVKSVLNDIQNAITSTVLATEQGEKIINTGEKLSHQTKTSIKKLAETITSFTDISLQTSVSSQEQFIGMDQVAIAMENIKAASSHNALTTKELEQSARNLQKLADSLQKIVSIFQV